MTRARLRAPLREDERGFTILETVIAITVIFASLTALAYTATAGFSAIAYSRERIQATGYANKVMEEVRGLAYSKITLGLSSSDLTGDSKIVSCSGTYRFESCSGEKIVSSAGVASTTWINPHTGSISGAGTLSGTWAVYITNEDVTTNPYRVTVIVNFTSKAHPNASNNLVRIQSLFWSPSGCVSSETHPYAAPCQPFYYGQASVPVGRMTIAGQIHNSFLTWSQSTMNTTGVEADLQQEQVSELQATYTQSGVTQTDDGVTTSSGGTTTTSSAADTDPAGPVSTYDTSSISSGGADTLSVHQSDSYVATTNEIGLTVSTPAGDAGRADAAVEASGSDVCPPPTDTAESDSLPCAGSRIQQGGTITATSRLTHVASSLGPATILNIAAATSNPNKAFVDREAVSGEDGRVEMTSTRRMGTINIGGLPTGMTNPSGFDASGTPVYDKYCVTLDAYQDTTTAQAGTSTSVPAATVNSGTIWYYNGSGYSSKAATDTALDTQTVSCTRTDTVNSKTVVWTVSVSSGGFTHATTSTSSTAGSESDTRTDVESSVTPPSIVVNYTITVAGVTEIDYTITLDLGVNRARGVYAPAPSSG